MESGAEYTELRVRQTLIYVLWWLVYRKRPDQIMKEVFYSLSYASSGSLFGYDYWGKALGPLQRYYAGGYLEYLSETNRQQSLQKIKQLRQADWLSNGARLLLVGTAPYRKLSLFALLFFNCVKNVAFFIRFSDIQIYNPNVNYFIFLRLGVEIPATGGVIPSYLIKSHIIIIYTYYVIGTSLQKRTTWRRTCLLR